LIDSILKINKLCICLHDDFVIYNIIYILLPQKI